MYVSEIKQLPGITQFSRVQKPVQAQGFLVSHCAIQPLGEYLSLSRFTSKVNVLSFLMHEVRAWVADRILALFSTPCTSFVHPLLPSYIHLTPPDPHPTGINAALRHATDHTFFAPGEYLRIPMH